MSISHMIEQPEQGGDATKVSFSGTLHTGNPGGEGGHAAPPAEPQLPLRGRKKSRMGENRFPFALRGAGAALGGGSGQKLLGHCTRGLCFSGCGNTNETLNEC